MGQNNSSHLSSHWKKGNITLLVIFILLASALVSLLAMTQLKNLMKYGETTNNFFKAYYLSKAGLELALTEVSTRDVGFEIMEVDSGALVVKDNLHEYGKLYFPYWSRNMNARSNALEVVLGPRENITIPLFVDETKTHPLALDTGVHLQSFDFTNDDINTMSFKISQAPQSPEKPFMVSVFSYSGDFNYSRLVRESATIADIWSEETAGPILREVSKLVNDGYDMKTYLIIFNQSAVDTGSFLISWNSAKQPRGFGLWTTEIFTLGHYGDTEIGMRALFSEEPPSRSF